MTEREALLRKAAAGARSIAPPVSPTMETSNRNTRSNAPRSVDSRLPLFDVRQDLRDDFRLRLRALRAAVVEAHAHRAGFQVATAVDELSPPT